MLAAVGMALVTVKWSGTHVQVRALSHMVFLHAQRWGVPYKDSPDFSLPCGKQVWREVT